MDDRKYGQRVAAEDDRGISRSRIRMIAFLSLIGAASFSALSAIAQSAVAKQPVLLAAWFTADRAMLVLLILLTLTLTITGWVMILRRRVQQQTHVIRRNRENELALEER